MFEMHLISGITDGWQGCESPPTAKLNVKTGPYLACISVFTILLVTVDRFFWLVDCCFSECFPVISGFCIAVQYQICYCFSIVF